MRHALPPRSAAARRTGAQPTIALAQTLVKDARARHVSLWVTTLQFLLVVSWTLYALFLPPLLDAAGMARRWVVWLLALDQAIFAISDWAAGVYADRVARALQRIGPILIALALASSAALLALPWAATLGQPGFLVGVALLWAATSSILRAPAFSLLARAGGVSTRSSLVSVALVGIGVGGAVGPLLTTALRGADPRLPLAVAAIALAGAALFAARIENGGQGVPPRPRVKRGWVVPLVAAVLVAAFGMQLHTVLSSDGLYRRFPEVALDLLRPTFWLGFAAGLGLAAWLDSVPRPLRVAGAASLVGAVGLIAAQLASSVAVLAVAQSVAGAAWAVVFSVAIATALARGGPTGAGTPVGLLFSALALAAVMRLGMGGLGLHTSALVAWIPAITWIVAAALLATVPSAGARHERASAPA